MITFGTYTFPAGFYPAAEPLSHVLPHAKQPRTDGGRTVRGSLDGKKLSVVGGFIKGPLGNSTNVNADLDTMKRNLLANAPASLYYGRADRYYRNVSLEGELGISYDPTGFGRIANVQVNFLAGDPFAYATSTNTDTWTVTSSGQTHGITTGGTAYQQPTFSITVGGAGAQPITYTLTNTGTGKAFTLNGNVTGGDVIVVDTLNQTVTIAGVDKMSLFDGQWIELRVGTDTVQETYGATAITQIVTSWQDRYY